jgi:hypothetical protein
MISYWLAYLPLDDLFRGKERRADEHSYGSVCKAVLLLCGCRGLLPATYSKGRTWLEEIEIWYEVSFF